MRIAFIYMSGGKNVGRGAGYVFASIPKGHEAKFFELRGGGAILLEKILEHDPNILMLSSMTLTWPIAVNIMEKFKNRRPTVPILVGGIHPTIMKESILKEYPFIDYVCVGEGESFVGDFVSNYDKNRYKVPNLIYRKDGKIYSNAVRPPEDLSKLPNFPWDLFPHVVTTSKTKLLYVTASRGCPYNCTYCCNSIYLKLYKSNYIRRRPIQHILDELDALKKKHTFDEFYFGDDMMFTDMEYAKELFTGIKEQLDTPYGCMGRCESINDELVDHLKKTGCNYIALGIECGNEVFRRKYLKRHMTNKQIIDSFRILKERNIRTTSFNMIGWPVENDDDLCKDTADINRIVEPDIKQVTWFYPFPGTELYDYCTKCNLITDVTTTYHRGSTLKMHTGKGSPVKYLEKF